MNILLFGKTGQVGWELQRALAPLGNLIALDVHSKDFCGDFSNPEGIAETVRAIKPDVIVNAAAHTAVDKAESEPDFARLLNATSVAAIAKEAAKIDAWFLVSIVGFFAYDEFNELPEISFYALLIWYIIVYFILFVGELTLLNQRGITNYRNKRYICGRYWLIIIPVSFYSMCNYFRY